MSGHSLALFLLEVLQDAVQEINNTSDEEELQSLMQQYTNEEEETYQRALSAPIPEELQQITNSIREGGFEHPKREPMFGSIDLRELYKRKSFCHTALLPSQIRYKGLLRPSFNQTDDNPYDLGIQQPEMEDPVEKDGGEFRLAFNLKEHKPAMDCPQANIDFKDFFYLGSNEGTKTMLIPNDASKEYYKVDTSKMLGMVLMCPIACDWGRCESGDLRDRLDEGNLRMKVNGVPVKKFDMFHESGTCMALKGAENEYKWTPNENGQFLIEAEIKARYYRFLRIGSFILV